MVIARERDIYMILAQNISFSFILSLTRVERKSFLLPLSLGPPPSSLKEVIKAFQIHAIDDLASKKQVEEWI
jgi:hypothetical protein